MHQKLHRLPGLKLCNCQLQTNLADTVVGNSVITALHTAPQSTRTSANLDAKFSTKTGTSSLPVQPLTTNCKFAHV